MILQEFYDRYQTSQDKTPTLNNEKLKTLQNFQTYLFEKSFINKKGLVFQGIALVQTEENLRQFHTRLLAFFLEHVKNEETAKNEPFLSIQMYFTLQTRGIIYNSDKSNSPEDFLNHKVRYSFQQRIRWLQSILSAQQASQRQPMRLHEKFLRIKKTPKQNGRSQTLITEIQNRINARTTMDRNRLIAIDGYSARSVIIALHRSMSNMAQQLSSRTHNIFNGNPIYFQIGETIIQWLPTPAKQHGRMFLEMHSPNASKTRLIDTKASSHPQKDVVHKFPYEKELTNLLTTLENKLNTPAPKNLMALIKQKFSQLLTPFVPSEFIGAISEEEVHFLNAFSFLIQIAETARYLKDGLNSDRDIESEPISLALAVTKALKIDSLVSWEDIYSNAPKEFKAGKTAYAYNKTTKKYDSPSNDAFGGLDAVSGKGLLGNYTLVQQKTQELSKRRPNHLSNILSARHAYGFLKDAYGSGDESDSDNESVISITETLYLHSSLYQEHLRKCLDKKFITFSKDNKLTEDHERSLRGVALTAGFTAIDAGGGGNCFFHAVVHQLNILSMNVENHDHESLRAAALDYVLNNWDNFRAVIHDPDDFVRRMSTTGEWADHEIIAATALKLNISIRIYRDDGAAPNHINADDFNLREITLGYYVDAHYVSFVRRKTELIAGLFARLTIQEPGNASPTPKHK